MEKLEEFTATLRCLAAFQPTSVGLIYCWDAERIARGARKLLDELFPEQPETQEAGHK